MKTSAAPLFQNASANPSAFNRSGTIKTRADMLAQIRAKMAQRGNSKANSCSKS